MVHVTDDDRGVRRVHLVRDALDTRVVAALADALAVPDPVRCVLLTGGDDVFCSGASAEVIEGLRRGEVSPTELLLPRAVLDCRVPVVAAARGHAIGGGLALVASCDLAVLALDRRYGATFTQLGFTPGMGITALLEHFLPPALAWDLLLTGRRATGRELAGHWPQVVEGDEVLARATELCWQLADQVPHVVGVLKRTLAGRRREAFERARTSELLMHELTFGRRG
ncbi:MAG: enoyl-CoA hydratase/isomerase family protein [Myxococcales bacterium]|nr:enoyl-CoA hydratase/isomerase family protein [Myxococcales bacterium]